MTAATVGGKKTAADAVCDGEMRGRRALPHGGGDSSRFGRSWGRLRGAQGGRERRRRGQGPRWPRRWWRALGDFSSSFTSPFSGDLLLLTVFYSPTFFVLFPIVTVFSFYCYCFSAGLFTYGWIFIAG